MNPASRLVSKFGGTSMGDAACMRRSALVAARRGSRLVVVSATSGTTNDLITLGQKAQSGHWEESENLLRRIRDRHLGLGDDLGVPPDDRRRLAELLDEMDSIARGVYLLRDCSTKALDTLMSLGERLSSVLFVTAMNEALGPDQGRASWLDAREVLRTDDQFGRARPLTESIRRLCAEKIPAADAGVFVTQGFIGSTEDGATTTLGRGGSDYSAALLAEAIDADVLEIWTDVPGIATTDPRLCPAARSIAEISFKEASELATFGAKVLHPATLLPAIRRDIPVFVGSSFDPQERGTWVRRDVVDAPLVRALALRKKQVLVTLTTPEMLNAHGFLAKIFKVFDDNQVSVDAITTSEISVSLTLDESALLNRKLLQELSRFADVHVEDKLTLIALIGNSINHTAGLAKRVFDAIEGINVRMICLGASKHNFCFLVDEGKAEEAVKRLHRSFIEV
ncbi:MAG: lysine-sensitive aspartokinase 3 [Bdellovibrionaceae bacterium]|nr:lysine-sensitive aspartokinase 3 [Pseudobdellovibrionaceae bacterium]MBX3034840.1 lysine-sensitive aspartokinase 3 [Pseudobdellovibrionaceae bacterium]